MQKILTKKQKETECIRQIKNFVNTAMIPELLNELKTVLKSKKLPQNWYNQKDHLLARFIIDNFCEKIVVLKNDYSEETKKEFETVKNNLKKP